MSSLYVYLHIFLLIFNNIIKNIGLDGDSAYFSAMSTICNQYNLLSTGLMAVLMRYDYYIITISVNSALLINRHTFQIF